MIDLKDFSSLVDLYYSKVFYHCVKIIKNNYDSDDITQNTFIKAFINIENLKHAESFGIWIFTICNNEIRQFYRSKQKNIPGNLSIENISEKSTPNDLRKYNNLYSAINILEEKYRNLIILKYFAEFSVKEIAQIMGANESLVKSRLYDARKKLEKLLLQSEDLLRSLNFFNQERRDKIMSNVKLLELGSHVIPRMSDKGINELLHYAENNEKFSMEVISELGRIDKGSEFAVECGGKVSYDELIKILACLGWGDLYRFKDTHKIMRDIAKYHGIGGYVESIETALYVSSIKDTVNWYKKYLGWDSDFSREAEDYGHAIVHVCSNEDSPYMSKEYRRFHLRSAGENQQVTKCSFFIIVTHKQLELIRERVVNVGWDKVSDIHDAGFGPMRFVVEDLNGVGLEFLEWNHDE